MQETQIRYVMKHPKNPGVLQANPLNPRLMSEYEYSQEFENSPKTNESARKRLESIEQIFTLTAASTNTAFTQPLPPFSRITEVWFTNDTTLTYTTATAIGIGNTLTTLAGVVAISGTTTAKATNTGTISSNYSTQVRPVTGGLDNTNSSTAQTLYLSPVNSGGTYTAGNLCVGVVRVNIIYDVSDPPFPHP